MGCLKASSVTWAIDALPSLTEDKTVVVNPFFDDVPMVLTASRLEQSALDAPAPVTVIDRDMIRDSGFTEIHDLMRLVPGFQVADWPSGNPVVVNHGLGDAYDRRIKVMIDGIAVFSGLFGNVGWDSLPIRVDDIERIEVVRGPNGAAYGVNAFQGVINLITRSPVTEEGKTLVARYGRGRFFDVAFRYNAPAQPDSAFDWHLSASRRGQLNFKERQEPSGRMHSRESQIQNTLHLSVSRWLGTKDEVRFRLGLNEGVYRRGASLDLIDPPHAKRSQLLQLDFAWLHSLRLGEELSLRYHHRREDQREGFYVALKDFIESKGLPHPPDLAERYWSDLGVRARRDELEMQYLNRLNPKFDFLMGVGLRHQMVKSQRFFNRPSAINAPEYQLFGSVTWRPLQALSIQLGGTWEKHHYSGNLLSPRLAVNYLWNDQQSLRFSAGRAYRAPSMMESHAYHTVKVDNRTISLLESAELPILSEKVDYFDMGYVSHLRTYGVQLDARAFYERYANYIDATSCLQPPYVDNIHAHERCPSQPRDFYPIFPQQKSFIYGNSGRFKMQGAEFSLDWYRPAWGRVRLTQAFIDIDSKDSQSDPDIPLSAPKTMTSLMLVKVLPQRWRVSMTYYHKDQTYWLNNGDKVPARDRFDLKIAKHFGPRNSDNELALTALNVNGRSYPEFHQGKYRHEPRLFVSLRLSW